MKTDSPLATAADFPRISKPRGATLFGVVVHTTGQGVPSQAERSKMPPLRVALNIYGRSPNPFPHYVIGGGGELVQICAESQRAWHAGVEADDRAAYLDGTWEQRVSPTALALWKAKWPGVKSPSHLYPTVSPNDCTLGVELVPLLVRDSATKTLYTPAQYSTLAKLLADIAERHQIKLKGNRLLGHEDIEPLRRWSSPGGWDPGALRATAQHFKWELVKP